MCANYCIWTIEHVFFSSWTDELSHWQTRRSLGVLVHRPLSALNRWAERRNMVKASRMWSWILPECVHILCTSRPGFKSLYFINFDVWCVRHFASNGSKLCKVESPIILSCEQQRSEHTCRCWHFYTCDVFAAKVRRCVIGAYICWWSCTGALKHYWVTLSVRLLSSIARMGTVVRRTPRINFTAVV